MFRAMRKFVWEFLVGLMIGGAVIAVFRAFVFAP